MLYPSDVKLFAFAVHSVPAVTVNPVPSAFQASTAGITFESKYPSAFLTFTVVSGESNLLKFAS